jgi:hypothetical protein
MKQGMSAQAYIAMLQAEENAWREDETDIRNYCNAKSVDSTGKAVRSVTVQPTSGNRIGSVKAKKFGGQIIDADVIDLKDGRYKIMVGKGTVVTSLDAVTRLYGEISGGAK